MQKEQEGRGGGVVVVEDYWFVCADPKRMFC